MLRTDHWTAFQYTETSMAITTTGPGFSTGLRRHRHVHVGGHIAEHRILYVTGGDEGASQSPEWWHPMKGQPSQNAGGQYQNWTNI